MLLYMNTTTTNEGNKMKFENIKVGQYVYCSHSHANVRVLAKTDLGDGALNDKRVSVCGYSAPYWYFDAVRPAAETQLHTRGAFAGCYEQTGVMGKQGEAWAISEFNDFKK